MHFEAFTLRYFLQAAGVYLSNSNVIEKNSRQIPTCQLSGSERVRLPIAPAENLYERGSLMDIHVSTLATLHLQDKLGAITAG